MLQLRYQTEPIDTIAPINILCGTKIGSSFTTQFHLPKIDIQEGDIGNDFFYFTKVNFLVNFEEEPYKDEATEIQIDDNSKQPSFQPIMFSKYDKDYQITVFYGNELFIPFEIGEFKYNFELFSFNNSFVFSQKVNVEKRKGIFEKIEFDQPDIGKVGCLQIIIPKPFTYYPKKSIFTLNLGINDAQQIQKQDLQFFIKNVQIKNIEFDIQDDLLVIKNFDRNDFYDNSQILDFSICNLEVPFIYKETSFGFYNQNIIPRYHLFEAKKQIKNNMPGYQMNYGLNNSLTEDKIFILDFELQTKTISIIMLQGFRMVFKFQGQQQFQDITYTIKNFKNDKILGEGNCIQIGEYYSMLLENDIDLKIGIFIELQSKEKVQRNIQMNQITFNFMSNKKDDLLFYRDLILPLFVFQPAKFQNIITLSNYDAGQQSNLTLLLSRDQIGFIQQISSDITITYNNLVLNTDNTIVKFKTTNESLENEKIPGGIIIKNFPIQKYAKIELEIQFLKNSWYDTTIKDVLVSIKNTKEKYSESFLLQLKRPSLQVQDFGLIHFENKFQADLKILTSEQILIDHSLRISFPKSLKIENSTKCAKIKQMGQTKDLNCFKIEQQDDEKYYFKIENPFTQIQPQVYSEMQIIGQTFDYETQEQKLIEFDIIGKDQDNIFDDPISNINLSYKKIIHYQIPCAQNCHFCFSNVFYCDMCADGYEIKDKVCLQAQKPQTNIIIEQLDLVYTASFFRVIMNILISLSFLGLLINLYLKMIFKKQFDILEGLIVVFSFQHSLLNYALLYQVSMRSTSTNQLIFAITIVLLAIIVNIFLTYYIITKKNFLYSKVRIFNIRSDSVLFMILYILFGTGFSLWISAFKYIDNLGNLYFTGKDKKQFNTMTRTLKIANSIFVLLETIFFLMIFLLNSDQAQIIFIYLASGLVLFIILLVSLLTSKTTTKDSQLLFANSVVNPVEYDFKYLKNVKGLEGIEVDETQSDDPHEKELIRVYLGNLRERYQTICKRDDKIQINQLNQNLQIKNFLFNVHKFTLNKN